MEVLKEHGIAAYEYGERDLEKDQQIKAKYRKVVEE